MNVLAVDPGKMTGLARWIDGEWSAKAEPYDEAMSSVHACLAGGVFELCVFEDFVITGRTLQTGGDWKRGKELEFIGVGRYLAARYGVPFETQTPSDAKSFATDSKLRAMGWWTRGVDHPRDASRHLLLALVRHRAIDLAALAAAVR